MAETALLIGFFGYFKAKEDQSWKIKGLFS
jgi:hypothetical protein